MAQEAQKSRITEIQVRMDCNGCVHKIKKALHGINGIYDLYIDLPQQKITIVGWADPEKIVKAIKKTRKSAIICSHIEPPEQPPAQPAEPATEGGGTPPPPDSANPPLGEPAPPTESTTEPPKDPPPPPPEAKPSPDQAAPPSTETAPTHQAPEQPTRPKDVEEVHVIYHYPPDYGYGYNISHGYGGHSSSYPTGGAAAFRAEPPGPPPPLYSNNNFNHSYGGRTYTSTVPAYRPEQPMHAPPPLYGNTTSHGGYGGQSFRPDPSPPPPPPQPQYATHSYNTHRPSPYVTQYEYIRPPQSQPPPPPPQYTNYSRPVPYSDDYQYHMGNNNNGSFGAAFSDENPNACTIV